MKSCQLLICSFCVVYLVFTCLSVYNLYCRDDTACLQPDKHSNIYSELIKKRSVTSLKSNIGKEDVRSFKYSTSYSHVEIWGKAAIGLYLWGHIMNGKLEKSQGGLIQQGNLTIKNVIFTFRTGPGIIPSTVPSDVKYLVLVLNGRSQEKILSAIIWLDYMPMYTKLQKLAVVLLGNEECNNDWILPYMKSRGGTIDVVFVVYDSSLVDNVEFYQWPLGVAVYREFPNVIPSHVDVKSVRPFQCNFLGTVYVNSSRQTLIDVVKNSPFLNECIINGRKVWPPLETKESLDKYVMSLLKSDLTLNPVGKNTECYRIYEAMSLGGVPVVEDVVTSGNCDKSSRAPLRLLKYYNAPLIYLKDWHKLPEILLHEKQLTLEMKVMRRISVIKWYEQFKKNISSMFVNVINDKFFNK